MSASDLPQPRALFDPPPGWRAWATAQSFVAELPGHRERVCCEAWFDRDKQSLVLAIHQYDESMSSRVPCWTQIQLLEVGPFFARAEVRSLAEMFTDTVVECWNLPK